MSESYYDIVQKQDFRKYVEDRISVATGTGYRFPSTFPKLFRYRRLSDYSIGDITKNTITLSSIGEFNDAFDGAIHRYGTKEEREKAAEEEWKKLDNAIKAIGLENDFLKREDFVGQKKENLKRVSHFSFRELEYLGIYVCALSTDNDSILMWSHYADSNKGICIEYDFNQLAADSFFRKIVYPVAYAKKPIDVSDLIEDKKGIIIHHSLEAAVLCSALIKGSVWSYEHEWRVVFTPPSLKYRERHLECISQIKPSKVYLGYHFLKQFFYYNNHDSSEEQRKIEQCTRIIHQFNELVLYLQRNSIPIAVMTPSVGSFKLISREISSDELLSLLRRRFYDDKPMKMKYYYTVHDSLMSKLEKTQEDNHG